MTWSHRILRRTNGDLSIVEVYYEDDGQLMAWGSADVYATADEGVESLAEQVEWYRQALGQPIVDVAEFGVSSTAPAALPEKGLNLDNERRDAPNY